MSERDSGFGRNDDISSLLGRLGKSTDQLLKRTVEKMESSVNTPTQKGSRTELPELVKKQQALLERLYEPAFFIGTVVSINGDQKKENSSIDVSFNGRIIEAKPVSGLELKQGDSIRLLPSSCQIAGLSEKIDVGSICNVRKVVDSKFSEVDLGGSVRIVLNGIFSEKIQTNDRVILDSSGSIIVADLGKSERRFVLGSKPTVTWDDIGGLEDAKRQLIEMIEMPFRYPDLYKYYNLTQPNGALLLGPPGCGKTMLLEAAATATAKLHGQEAIDTGFINVKGPEILDMYVGVPEKAIRSFFSLARKHKLEHGYPALIVIDEADAILSRRDSSISSDMEKTIVTTFLTEMQGMDDSSAIVFLSTNNAKALDPAVIRDGRIDRNIVVPRPNRNSAETIFKLALKKLPHKEPNEELALFAASEFYSDKYRLYDISLNDGKVMNFSLAQLVNGAMIVGVMNKAVWRAFQRDLAAGGDKEISKRSAVTKEDITGAVQETFDQKSFLNHKDELAEFVTDFKKDIVGITPVKQVQMQRS